MKAKRVSRSVSRLKKSWIHLRSRRTQSKTGGLICGLPSALFTSKWLLREPSGLAKNTLVVSKQPRMVRPRWDGGGASSSISYMEISLYRDMLSDLKRDRRRWQERHPKTVSDYLFGIVGLGFRPFRGLC